MRQGRPLHDRRFRASTPGYSRAKERFWNGHPQSRFPSGRRFKRRSRTGMGRMAGCGPPIRCTCPSCPALPCLVGDHSTTRLSGSTTQLDHSPTSVGHSQASLNGSTASRDHSPTSENRFHASEDRFTTSRNRFRAPPGRFPTPGNRFCASLDHSPTPENHFPTSLGHSPTP